MWLDLAAAQGEAESTAHRDMVAAYMTPAQVAEAQTRASESKPTTNH
jgi:hypothetical protein